MKKPALTCCLIFIFSTVFSQTYYWVGGITPTGYATNSNWNTQLNGLGTTRPAVSATDTLIFDGTNVGGIAGTTGNVTVTTSGTQNCAQLKFKNGANVTFTRTAIGSSTININGDATAADDLVVDATSTLTLGGIIGNYDVAFVLGISATGLVSGTTYHGQLSTTVHTRSYISASTAGSMVFATGATCNITDSTATSGFHNSLAGAIVFKTGSTLNYYSGRSPIGSSSTLQYINFELGSNCYFKNSNVSYIDGTDYAGSSWVNQKVLLCNIIVQNGATLKADGPNYRMVNLTVDNGGTFTTHTSGHTILVGDLTVDGTLTYPVGSTNILVMGGHVPQTISGTGAISVPLFTIANYSDVTLARNVVVNTQCNINGKINFGATNQLTGTGTFTSRVTGTATAAVGNAATGSYILSGFGVGTLSGNTGLYVTGTGLDVNTQVLGFSQTNGTITLSKPALSNATGTTYSFGSDTATLVTSNTNGMDTLTGSMILSGTKSFQSGTNYIINAATTKPFGISSGTPAASTVGRAILNAPVTTNYNIRVTDKLTLAAGNLTIRPLDTLRILSGNNIEGAPFSNSKYIISSLSGNNAGVLRIDNFISSKLFPIGTATNYLPAALTPSSTMDYAVSVFEGVTEDGMPTGTPFTALKKSSIVDAVWTVNRINGTGDCVLETNWPATLEGSAFSLYADMEIGIGRYSAGSWGIVTGAGDNIANTAAATFNSFSPFSVGHINYVLPIQFKEISAVKRSTSIQINWKVANDDAGYQYSIERSNNAVDFISIGILQGTNKGQYDHVDVSASNNNNYYRIKATGPTGKIVYTNIVLIKQLDNISIDVYPNPVVNMLTIAGLKLNSSLRILNTNGEVVLQKNTNVSSLTIDVSKLKAGVYIIEAQVESKRISSKTFIKE